jgi:GDP-L-fucose synthase
MKKILVTGGTGMVGRNVVQLLQKHNHEVLSPSRKELNLFEYHRVDDFIKNEKPDLVIHCAGLVGGIQANMNNLFGFLSENLILGLNVVNASRNNGIKNLLNLGSSCMYPKEAKNPLKEDSILTGQLEHTNEGYARAKVSIAKLCQFAEQQEGLNYKTLIPCNLYGYWDKFDPQKSHMIPAAIRKVHLSLTNGEDIQIWGTGKTRREFMFAEDLADFILFTIDKMEKIPNMLNVGLGTDYTIQEYYETIKDVIGSKSNFSYDLTKPEGMKQKVVDTTLQSNLGWAPKTSLREGIRKTYQFYLENIK